MTIQSSPRCDEVYKLFQSMLQLKETTGATIKIIATPDGTGFHFTLEEAAAPEQFRKIKDESLWVTRLLEGELTDPHYLTYPFSVPPNRSDPERGNTIKFWLKQVAPINFPWEDDQ